MIILLGCSLRTICRMAAVTFYLMLPYTGLYVGQIHHVLPMTLFLGTLLAYRYPTLAGSILGMATAATYFPLFVLPIWLSRLVGWKRVAGGTARRALMRYVSILSSQSR